GRRWRSGCTRRRGPPASRRSGRRRGHGPTRRTRAVCRSSRRVRIGAMVEGSPRDRFITVFGRTPVLEALRDGRLGGDEIVVVPRAGSPRIGPLVIKASAGVAFSAPILTTGTAAEAVTALRGYGFTCYGLAARAPVSLFDADLSDRSALVLGGETSGLSVEV